MKIFIDNVKNFEYLNMKNKDSFVDLNSISSVNFGSFFHPTLETLSNNLLDKSNKKGPALHFLSKKLKEEEFILEIRPKKITISAATIRGAYYGLLTLKDYQEEIGKVREIYVRDYPDLALRGFQIDISRSKVPKKETIFKIIDLLSKYRYNHLELYVEGFSFEYKSQPFVYKNENYITAEEYLDIQHYANQMFIDLVPSENGFGHMTEWLKCDEYKHLAVSDELFEIWGSKRLSSTIDPTNERSVALIKQLYKDMIPYSNSKYFNMNFDEPYELGYGKTKEKCDELGKEKVFTDYFNTLAEEVKKYNKTPLFWGDFIIHNPKAIKQIDKDAILIDWGYNYNYPFEEHAEMLNKQRRKFILAAGTSSWSSASSKLLEMIYSVRNAVSAAVKNDAFGVILTDWGDFGHLQYFINSVPGIIFTSKLMWNSKEQSIYFLKETLQEEIGDSILAQVLLELSLYNMQEEKYKSYSTKLFNPIIQAELVQTEEEPILEFEKRCLNSSMSYLEMEASELYLKYLREKLALSKSLNPIKIQIENTIKLLQTLVNVQRFIQAPNINDLNNINKEFDEYLSVHKKIWKEYNKLDGYELSSKRIITLQNCLLKLINKKEAKNE